MDAYRRRAEALGCAVVLIDGHDIAQIGRRRNDPVFTSQHGQGFPHGA